MEKKEAILLAALKLLTEKGIHNTPMSAIAKEAGTGMGTIYNYFPNKEILINELYLSIKQKEKALFTEFESDQPIKTQFENYFTVIVRFFVDNPLYFRLMEQLQASPMISEASRAEGLTAVESVVDLLESGQKQRIIKKMEMGELLMFIGGAILSYLRWYFSQGKNKKVVLKDQKRLVWDAIKA